MGKNKKKKQQRRQQGLQDGHAGEQEEEEEDDACVEQQRRLLEFYSRSKDAPGADAVTCAGADAAAETGGVGAGSPDVEGSPASGGDACAEGQRHLPVEAEKAPVAAPGDAAGSTGQRGEVFAVRRVSFHARQVPVLLQNRNGPCALLAVANALSLRGTFKLRDDETSVTSEDLVSRLAQLCETLNAKAAREDANAREMVSQVVRKLPHLLDGLQLNCHFSACSDFEYTLELGLFDCFDLQLYHAWVAPHIAEVVGSWNALAERLAICSELRGELERAREPPTPAQEDALARGLWLEQWLEETRAQATPRGLQDLVALVREREICVLFRNNHFCTIYKPDSARLCALLTDTSFEDIKSVVWETIETDGGAGNILNADFKSGTLEGVEASVPQSSTEHHALSSAPAELLQTVMAMGFDRKQAEAGLDAVNWRSAEAAVEAILEPGGSPAATGEPHRGIGAPTCPSCGKEFNDRNGLLSHRTAKGH